MGKWESKLQELLKISADNKQMMDEFNAKWQQVLAAAQAFISAHGKVSPKVAKSYSQLTDAEEQGCRAVAELSVYEEEYEAAKKARDKDQMKALDEKMKPLIKSWEDAKKKHQASGDEMRKQGTEIESSIEALTAACG
jgi:hypothetical protein